MSTAPYDLGVSDFDSFLTTATALVGEEHVSRDLSAGASEGLDAVRPSTVDEVRALVRAANDCHVLFWVVSRGKNLGYGGSAPVVDGSVIVDLQRMDKIIEINEEYAYAIVEPGVTFMQLYDEIQKRKLNLWPSVPAIGWGSVVGNTLERGIGYTPEGAHYKRQCGMEVVLPDDDLLRTGNGAGEESAMWPLYSGGFGPGLDGLFFQSNFGIVTKTGIHMSPAPEAYARIVIEVAEETDVVPLLFDRTTLLITGMSSVVFPPSYLRADEVTQDFLPQTGVPSIAMSKVYTSSTTSGLWHNCYAPALPPSGRELYQWYLGAKRITTAHDLNFIADFHVFDRWVIAINLTTFHPAARGRLESVQKDLMEHSRKEGGYMEYRTHVNFMDETAKGQTFNRGAFVRFTTKLKDTLDPKGVLSPGKSGIWNAEPSWRAGKKAEADTSNLSER
ncbi:hypothetical protein OQA88_1461 [Cercophora sp. LCS_1]